EERGADGADDPVVGRKEDQPSGGDLAVVDPDGKLADPAAPDLGLDAEFLMERVRRPGGPRPATAIPDDDPGHQRALYPANARGNGAIPAAVPRIMLAPRGGNDKNIPPSPSVTWAGGGIGRHVRLRGVCRKACEFESRPAHHPLSCRPPAGTKVDATP